MLKNFFSSLALAVTIVFSYAPDEVSAEMSYAPQTSDERGVKVTVTRQSIPNEANIWNFEVILETHTRDLGDDLAKSAVLIADGKQYLPLDWQGAPPGGHHRKGWLRFKAIEPQPRSIELQLRLAADTLTRSFKWQLK